MSQVLTDDNFPQVVSKSMEKMYDLAIDHAIEVVKSQGFTTTDINNLMEVSSMKNNIISKLLSLQKK